MKSKFARRLSGAPGNNGIWPYGTGPRLAIGAPSGKSAGSIDAIVSATVAPTGITGAPSQLGISGPPG